MSDDPLSFISVSAWMAACASLGSGFWLIPLILLDIRCVPEEHGPAETKLMEAGYNHISRRKFDPGECVHGDWSTVYNFQAYLPGRGFVSGVVCCTSTEYCKIITEGE